MGNGVSVLVELLLSIGVILRHNTRPVLFVVEVVDEHVVDFRLNHCLDQFARVVSFSLQECGNDVHNFGTQSGAPHKVTVYQVGGQHFEMGVGVVNQLVSGVTQFLHLRSNQVLKHVNRGESRNGVSFVLGNGQFNLGVGVLLRGREVSRVVVVQLVEARLDLRANRKFVSPHAR